jgi:outer membrane protein assembly factor BamA
MRLLLLLVCAAGFVLAQDQPLVRSIRFEHFKNVSSAEILDRLNEREVALTVESPYRPEEAERAKTYIAQLLAEKGHPNARIQVAARPVLTNRVEVRFTLLK